VHGDTPRVPPVWFGPTGSLALASDWVGLGWLGPAQPPHGLSWARQKNKK